MASAERAVRPFVDTPATPAPAVRAAAEHAAATLGLGPVELLRLGMNGVFVAGDAVLRVSRPTAPGALAYDLADVLVAHGVPVPRPARGDVVVVDGLSVTVWQRLVPSGEPIEWLEVGRAVARVHAIAVDALPPGLPLPSPAGFPWWDFGALLADTRDEIEPVARRQIEEAIARHDGWRVAVATDGVVCHGDVHPGNVVMTADGPFLVDWDLLCRAPAAWDHAPMLTWAERWGGAPGEYEAFAAGYGASFRDAPDARAFAELRLVAATLMRVRAGRTDPLARVEAERRLRYWRGDAGAPPWRAQ